MKGSVAEQRIAQLGLHIGDRIQSYDGYTGVLDDVSDRIVRVLWDDADEDGQSWHPEWIDYRSIERLDEQVPR